MHEWDQICIRSLRELHDKNGRGSLNDRELPLSHVPCVSLRNGFCDSRPVHVTAGAGCALRAQSSRLAVFSGRGMSLRTGLARPLAPR